VLRERGRLRAQFADGSDTTCDLLIGCDGVHSTVRTAIDSCAPAPRYEGLLTTGGYVRGVPVATEPGSYEMVFGHRAFFGYVLATHGEVWWFANVPTRPEPSHTELIGSDTEERRRQLLKLFARDAGPARDFIEATPEITPLTPIHTLPRLPKWQQDGMIVIGDAAHAPSPTSGQGASLSIEDAALLAIFLRQEAEQRTALARFEDARRPRVERIAKWAARINNSKAPGVVGRVVRDAVMPSIMRLTADGKAQRRIFEHHIEWGRETAGAGAPA
jgi:2-polyprenyl-6-methoxyphenol hydroxylase-like FAD-dependent oxidoreductase